VRIFFTGDEMEIKPLGSQVFQKAEGESYKEILQVPPTTEPQLEEDADFIGVSDVAKLLDITVDRVRYLSRKGTIPSFTLRERGARIYQKEAIAKLDKHI